MAAHKAVEGRPEGDKLGTQQAWERSTCKQLPGTEAVPPLCAGNISSGGTDRNKAEEEEPHRWAVQEARTSWVGVRKDWGEAYMRSRTAARPQQQRSPQEWLQYWGILDPIPYSPEKP